MKLYRYSDAAVSSIPTAISRLRFSLSSSAPAPTLPARFDAEYMPTIAPPIEAVAPSDFAYAEITGSCMNRSRNATSTTARMDHVVSWPERPSCTEINTVLPK